MMRLKAATVLVPAELGALHQMVVHGAFGRNNDLLVRVEKGVGFMANSGRLPVDR